MTMTPSTRIGQLQNFERSGLIDNEWCDNNMQRVRELLLLRARYVRHFKENELSNPSEAQNGSNGVAFCNGELMVLLSINTA